MDPVTLAPLVQTLRMRSRISSAEEAAILALPFTVREKDVRRYIIRQGDIANHTSLIISGFAYRHKTLSDGGRQIVAYQMPGDICDLHNALLIEADHNIQALTAVVVAEIPRSAILQLSTTYPMIGQAFWRYTLLDASIAWEWLANIGRREAHVRLAHFLCEFALRLESQGIDAKDGFTIPFTQEQIGDALGLTSVHVNRTLRKLELSGLIQRTKSNISILDGRGLRSVAGFSSAYLHLNILNAAKDR